MRVLVLAASACVVLAGCGGAFGGPSDKQALVSACVEQGESEAACSCVTDALQKNLSPELFKKVAQAVGRDKQNMVEYMGTLPIEDLLAFSAVTNDLEVCGEAAATGG